MLLVLLAVLPALGVLLHSAVSQRQAAARAAHQHALHFARLVAHEHQRATDDTRRLLVALSTLAPLQDPALRGCPELLRTELRVQPEYMNFGVATEDGEILCSARGAPPGVRATPAGRATIREALRRDGFAVSGYARSAVGGLPTMLLVQALPGPAGAPRRVAYALLGLDRVNALIARERLPRQWSVSVVDRDGVILARSPDPERWVGQSADSLPSAKWLRAITAETTLVGTGLDGTQRLIASVPLRDSHGVPRGHVSVGAPEALVFAAADATLRRSLALLALIAALSLAAAAIGGRIFILRHLNALLLATRRLKEGDPAARTGIATGPSELRQLAVGFDEMAAALQARQAEAERAAAMLRRQALVFDTLHEGVVITDADRRIIDWNPGAERIFGYSRHEVLGQEPFFCYEPAIASALESEVREAIRREGRWAGEFPFVRKDGSAGISEGVVVAQYDERGERVAQVGVHRDVTERRRAEEALRRSQEQLRQAHKMEAVGRLAGGIAHDFNNLLTAITGNTEMALLELAPTSPLRDDLEQIRQAADTAAGLTRQLLTFSRHSTPDPQALDLNRTVANTVRLLQRLIGPEVEIREHLQPELGGIRADAGQVEQILINLAVNARDAMPAGGRIEITTERVELTPEHPLGFSHLAPGEYALLSVSDTGDGMDAETQARIFEPFFTTKPAGKGTGLGLFSVYGIASNNGGHAWVESELGRGTTFRVLLPRAEAADPPPADPDPVRGGAETILLVEDEPPVRRLAHRLLERMGYHVLQAADGEEALLLTQRYAGPIHLMLTDLTMPRMGGSELATRISKERPTTRVIFMSGYSDDGAPPRRIGGLPTSFVQKPFSLNVLAKTVRNALDSVG